jgi:ATP-binding cassette subfamily B protein
MPTNEKQTKLKLENILRFRRAFSLVLESAPGWTIAGSVLVILQGALPLASLYLMKLIVDAVSNGATSGSTDSFASVAFLIAVSAFIALLSAFSRSLSTLVSEAQAQAVTDHVQNVLHAKSIEADLEYYENPQFYDSFHRAQREAPYRPTRIVNGLVQVLQNVISLLAIVGLLISFQWPLALVLVLASIPGILVKLRYSDQMYGWQCRITPQERKAWYLHTMLTSDAFAKELRLFRLGFEFKNQYQALRKRIRQERLEMAKIRALSELVVQAAATIAVFGSYAFVAYSAVQGAITIGSLVMYFGALQQGQTALQGIMSSLAGLYEDNLFLTSFYDFLDLKPKVVEPEHPVKFPSPIKDGITFRHVSFRYPGSDRLILSDINMHLSPGEIVSLVGENGSGKTTLIKLLCRLYDPTGGQITIDGTDQCRFSTASLRQEIGVIFQDYAHYNLAAWENVWFGDTSSPPQRDKIVEAASCSGADEAIVRLKRGYDTILGRWFNEGEELSIGEWQKVALARAFFSSAQVLVLDEPTSSLDARAEEEVSRKFRQLAAGRTVILISHRMSTVKMAKCIYFLKDGKIAESGTHEELTARSGEYAGLFEVQAKHYR